VAEIRRQHGQPRGDVELGEVPVEQSLYREAVAEIVVVPTSAQARICRPARYADVAEEVLLRAVFPVEVSA